MNKVDQQQFDAFFTEYLARLDGAMRKIPSHSLRQALDAIVTASARGGTVWLIGNGGSASLASHMATDLQLAGVRAVSLTDIAAITTAANDNSFEFSFVAQLEALARVGDCLLAISGSGRSPNIVRATEWARGRGITVVGLAGFNGGSMATDHLIHIPICEMGQAQDGQQVVLHVMAYYLMKKVKET